LEEIAAMSLPAPGSDQACAQITSPFAMGVRKRFFCLFGAELHDGRAKQEDAILVGAIGATGAEIFFLEDQPLDQIEPAPAIGFPAMSPCPNCRTGKRALPLDMLVIAFAAFKRDERFLGDMRLHPRADFGAEGVLFGGVGQVPSEASSLARFHERIAALLAVFVHVHFERKALFPAIAAIDVARLQPVQRFLGDDERLARFGGRSRRRTRGLRFSRLFARHHLFNRAKPIRFFRRNVAAGEEGRAHLVQRQACATRCEAPPIAPRSTSGSEKKASSAAMIESRRAANADAAANHEFVDG
jgi:hypothetical protein